MYRHNLSGFLISCDDPPEYMHTERFGTPGRYEVDTDYLVRILGNI